MKIVELTNEFSMGNGISDVIKNLSDGLSDNYEVEIWYNYFLRSLPITKANLIKKSYLSMFLDLLKIREKTIVHTHFGRTFFLGSLAKLFNKKIIHLHGEYINTPLKASGGKWLSFYFIEALHTLSYFYGLGIDKAVGISKYACSEIKRYGVPGEKIKLIYLGVNNLDKKTIKKIKDPINFGSLARFSKSKNLKFLFDNYETFPSESKLFVAGAIDILDKEYYLYCKNISIKQKIHVYENLPKEKLKKFYSKFDVFLYPSNWEGFGLPILEAMSHGKPVICFRKYSMPELVKNDYNGFTVKNEREFLEKLRFLAENIKEVERLGKNAYLTSQEFDKKIMVERYKKLIEEIIR